MYDNPKMDWRTIAIHNENNIKGFFGDYRWLSNWQRCEVWFEGLKYDCVECAYMAAKVEDEEIRKKIQGMSAYEAKKFGHTVTLRPGWDAMRLDVMLELSLQKYLRNPELRGRLLETGTKYLEETNYWHDKFWGFDYKLGGENHLGKILMKVREILK